MISLCMCQLFPAGTSWWIHSTPCPLSMRETTFEPLFVCVLAKWCYFVCTYLNFFINVTDLLSFVGFLPFSLITVS
jgi:hypothetical protein